MKRTTSYLASILLAVSACGVASDGSEEDGATSTTTTTTGVTTSIDSNSTDMTSMPEVSTTLTFENDPSLDPFVEQASSDLADRLDIPESAIEVVTARLVRWPDASLGCPEPGMQYAQVVTDGALIELLADGSTYSYHMGGDVFEPFLCEDPEEPAGDTGDGTKKGDTETVETPYGDLVVPETDDTVPPPRYDD